MKKSLELPNQQKIYFLNEEEALFLYDDIFVRQSYLQHGITLKPGYTVFDIGANIGLFALFAHQYCQGNINLFCFEPIKQIYKIMQKNMQLTNVISYNCGLWNEDSKATFDYFPHYSLLSGADAKFSPAEKNNFTNLIINNLNNKNAKKTNNIITQIIKICPFPWKARLVEFILEKFFLKTKQASVTLTSISEIIKKHELCQIDLVKLDTEKAELKILEGINSADWQKIQQLVIEVHDIQDRLNIIKNMLEKEGFECYVEAGSPPKFLAYSILGVTNPVFTNHYSQELLYTIYAKRIK
ncbi:MULTISPECIES: FkbM family methyltransferase [unclassified Moorena]|uniref:FkbM family methyltransferase n=2 Tax=unclassified Moorena TaxID=2683338 RepID=UPI0013C2659D|nr:MULTISPECIES: FkbM family methyltransferase [unclassified Moorena]NEO10320.1 FkbM family methyltransferase [Moorena sp. SIO3I8]NEP22518.1 FkbM family methyltransferase [Moorena sp. SIO3I6]